MTAATWIPPTVVECHGHDDAVPLDMRCYIGNLRNATTARGATSSGLPIQVTFRDASPPLLSYLCVHCPGLDSLRPEPRVVATDADLVLLGVPIVLNALLDVNSRDYFLYRPRARQLDLLPNPHPMTFPDSATALLSREDGAWYAVAAISSWCPVYQSSKRESIIRWDFRLHLYRSSDSEGWITVPVSVKELVRDKLVPLPCDLEGEMLYHKTAKTLTIGGERGTVAWVDLWRGILLCDVLGERPLCFQDIPLPVPARGNWDRLLEQCEPNYIRDVAISRHKDTIKYIEMEIWPPRTLKTPDSDSYLEWVRCKSSNTPGGWKATTWRMPIPVGSFTDWQSDCEVEVKDVTIDTSHQHHSTNLLSRHTTLTLQKLPMAYPTMSIDGDIVYFVSSTKSRHIGKLELVIAVDVRNKTLRGVAKLDVEKKFIIMPAFCTCEICRYPRKNTTAVGEDGTVAVRVKIAGAPKLRMLGYLEPRVHQLQIGQNVIKPDTSASPSTVVPSVKTLALKVNFGVLEEVNMLASILRCFPNVDTLHIESVISDDKATGSLHANFWREVRPIKCVKSHVKKMIIHEFRGEQSEIEFLKFVGRSAEKLRALIAVITEEMYASAYKVNEVITEAAALSRGAWASHSCVLVVGPGVKNCWSFRRASDPSVNDPFD